MKATLTIRHALALIILLFQLPNLIAQEDCNEDNGMITITLPTINEDIKEVGFNVPKIWNDLVPTQDEITIPNGRPIYALIVSGYASNQYLDEMMLYNFARNIMKRGGYVHYAWWNNLLAPYMERPLHHLQSEPGNLKLDHLLSFTTANEASKKAMPGEDYQFVEDAKIFLKAIREHNPDALIIVAGHSMGGGAVVHLADELSKEENPIQIDILAPIDPVGNRNIPWAGVIRQGIDGVPNTVFKDYNFTRWRVSRDGFKGYLNPIYDEDLYRCYHPRFFPGYDKSPNNDPRCESLSVIVHEADRITFGKNVKNLYHRYQMEAKFPYDYNKEYWFGRDAPAGAIDMQWRVPMKAEGEADEGGWLKKGLPQNGKGEFCCRSGAGAEGWDNDGHGEIVGYRGPVIQGNPSNGFPVPLAIRVKTSPQCGKDCSNLIWPSRIYEDNIWRNGNGERRATYLQNLEALPLTTSWRHRPKNPELCLVSKRHRGRDGLIELLRDIIPSPPISQAGEDQVVECTGQDGAMVTLDGSASERAKCYEWSFKDSSGDTMVIEGETVSLTLPLGSHEITLKVTDVFNREHSDMVTVDVLDTTGPVLTVSLDPNLLWPPNHKFVDITATVEAMDLCGTVESIVLHIIVVSEANDVIGSGNTSPDIAGANFGTEDTMFKLRAERSGKNHKRVYTVTYKATDDSGNSTFAWDEVIVENPANVKGNPHQNGNWLVEGYARNIPNPFSSRTDIKFYLTERSKVKITVYDLRGRVVATPFNGVENEGSKSISFDGKGLSPGIYIFSVATDKNIMMNKMVIKR